jgi:hypothetical protein
MNWKKELAYLVPALVVGALLEPVLVFLVGQALFGDYAEGAGLGTFFGNFWKDLLAADPVPWTMLFAPYLLVIWMRLVTYLFRRAGDRETVDQT